MKKIISVVSVLLFIAVLIYVNQPVLQASVRHNTATPEPYATIDISTNVTTLGHNYVQVPVANFNVAGATGTIITNIKVSTSATTSFYIQIIGGVDSLPTTGYVSGAICKLSSDGKVYIASETVVGIQSWKSLW